MTADFDEKLSVLRSLTDKRLMLNGEQVMVVADMSHERRVAFLAELVEREHDAALTENQNHDRKESQ